MSDDSKTPPSPPRTHTVTASSGIGIEAGAFDEFVKRQQTTTPNEPPVDWAGQRDEWLRYLEGLYAQIESFLKTYLSAGQVRCEYRQINLNEDDIGSYTANQMVLHIGQQEITFTPVGTMLIGMKGRVDVLGTAGEARLFLVNKKATGPRSLIHVTMRRVGGTPPPPVSEPQAPIEWAWKIASRPPQMNFIDLTQEAFFEMILAVANA
jgi:hypothetical protein